MKSFVGRNWAHHLGASAVRALPRQQGGGFAVEFAFGEHQQDHEGDGDQREAERADEPARATTQPGEFGQPAEQRRA